MREIEKVSTALIAAFLIEDPLSYSRSLGLSSSQLGLLVR